MKYLFVYGWFNKWLQCQNLRLHIINNDAYSVLYQKEWQRKQLWANLRYSLRIYLVGLSKIFHAIQKFIIIPK